MYRTYRNVHERACDCRCPVHHGRPRSIYNDPECHCDRPVRLLGLAAAAGEVATCAGQLLTLLARQINGVLFLDHHGALWYVPGLQPGHWDWRYATEIDAGHPLFEASELIADLLRETHTCLLPLIHLL
ncbi:hypothetical protein JNW88_19605 [Micromonospora sp. ATA32]|nr:hypothetical protein [Micromonospora sp. ATA32]